MNQKRDTFAIPSYGRRYRGRLSDRQKVLLESTHSYLRPYEEKFLSLKEYSYISLEIGVGSGSYFLSCIDSDNKLNAHYIGVDVYSNGISNILNNLILNKKNPNLVSLIHHDASFVVRNMIPIASCDEIFILFPDPWPKKKHQKRRLVGESFCQIIINCLKPQGSFFFSTDHKDYAKNVARILSTLDILCNEYAECTYGIRERYWAYWRTKYECKALSLGKPVFDVYFKKR